MKVDMVDFLVGDATIVLCNRPCNQSYAKEKLHLVQSSVLRRRLKLSQIERTGERTSLQNVVVLHPLGSGYSFRDKLQAFVRKFTA